MPRLNTEKDSIQDKYSKSWHTSHLHLDNKVAKKKAFQYNVTAFLETCASMLNTSWDWNVHTYATTQELKKKAFKVKRKNIKKAIGTQLKFVLEIKLKRYMCLVNYDCFLVGYASILNSSQDAYVTT